MTSIHFHTFSAVGNLLHISNIYRFRMVLSPDIIFYISKQNQPCRVILHNHGDYFKNQENRKLTTQLHKCVNFLPTPRYGVERNTCRASNHRSNSTPIFTFNR
ncbi:hypothetical protein ACOSQ3_027691 [Xanthoceras sorbifolium]